jgi:hypothetical protein
MISASEGIVTFLESHSDESHADVAFVAERPLWVQPVWKRFDLLS